MVGKRSKIAHRTKAQIRKHGRTYQAKPSQVKNRTKRNKARATMKKKVGAKAIRGKDVGHKRPLSKGGSNKASNLKVQSRKTNRGHGMSRGGNKRK